MSDRSYTRTAEIRTYDSAGKLQAGPATLNQPTCGKKGVRTCVKKRWRRRRSTSAGRMETPRKEIKPEITNEPPPLSRKNKEEEENLYYVGAPNWGSRRVISVLSRTIHIVQGDIFVLPCSKGFKIANAETGLLFMNFQRISFCSVTE